MPRVRLAALGLLAAFALLAIACGGGGDDAGDWTPKGIADSLEASPIQPLRVGSPPGVGPNRVAFALVSPDNSLVHDAQAMLRLYALEGLGDDVEGTLVGEFALTPATLREQDDHIHADGSTHPHDDPLATVYAASVEFDHSGDWGAELDVTLADGTRIEGLRTPFVVLDRSIEPAIGDAIPASVQTVLADVDGDITRISTAEPPNPAMHGQTVAEALAKGRPIVIAFATPAFCQTRFCGPIIDQVVRPLYERYSDSVEFIHIEPYVLDEVRQGRFIAVPQMAEWRLQSEPWVMVVDAEGRLAAKFEGITSAEEVGAALERILGGGWRAY